MGETMRSMTAITLASSVNWRSVRASLLRMRKNIVVAGGTGSGKTTLLNLLSGFIPADERIVTVEDAAELRLAQPHVVRLEARPPNIEGRGAVTIRDLVRNCLRMRPDRIIVGECLHLGFLIRSQEHYDQLLPRLRMQLVRHRPIVVKISRSPDFVDAA